MSDSGLMLLPEQDDLSPLRALSLHFPNVGSALSEIAALRAMLVLPKPVVHVISDIHGDYRKLRHVLNNASGRLRPLVEELFAFQLDPAELQELLSVLYYPRETMQRFRHALASVADQSAWSRKILRLQFELIRKLASAYRRTHTTAMFPKEYLELFQELLDEPMYNRGEVYVDTMIRVLAETNSIFDVVRAASRIVRNLSVGEILVAGDMGDRGERIDKVIDYLIRQPSVNVTWGNHDVSWMGACLGQEAAITTVLRISLRYQRIAQLEEGYGIPLEPLEHLARNVYYNDPAERFRAKGVGLRDDLTIARMQKAAAILNFKLEGQTIRRNPHWNMENRNLLHKINFEEGLVSVDGTVYPLLDSHFPTINPADPYALSPDEEKCVERLRNSFVNSRPLWDQMKWMVNHGSMWTRRDDVLIFHACVPCDEEGNFYTLKVDGVERKGRDLFDAFTSLIRRAFRKTADNQDHDADWLWYLWAGPLSPLFGKDKMATFETYFIEDKHSHHETKNPYFELIHDAEFCRRILREFGVSEDGLIVNGHVPVKIAEGEQPVKRGGNAVTIDGAFSEAYGDRGYTLILDPQYTALAEHSHFESVDVAITRGDDIVPKMTHLRDYPWARSVADTEYGAQLRSMISQLERLVFAYQEGLLVETV